MKSIQTGADRLVEVISAEKKISLDEASKKLGVGAEVIQEWAEFLEKEKLITIEYSLSKVWLCEKRLSKSEVSETAKELASEKDAFTRKIDSALKALTNDTSGFDEIKTQFTKIQSGVKDKIDIVEKELAELEKYTDFKQNIDKEIIKQRANYDQQLSELIKTIQKSKTDYTELSEKIAAELKDISSAHDKVAAMQRSQAALVTQVNSAKEAIKHLEKEIAQEEESIAVRVKRIDQLKEKASEMQNKLTDSKNSPYAKLVASITEDRKKILAQQDDLLKKAQAKTKELQDYSDLIEKIRGSFKGFFAKKIKTEQMIVKIEQERAELEKALKKLEEKANSIEIMNSSKELKSQIAEIGKALKDYEQNRSGLMRKIDDLIVFIKT